MKRIHLLFLLSLIIILPSCSADNTLKTNDYFLYPNEFTVEYFANGTLGEAKINYDGRETLYVDFISELSPLYSMRKTLSKSYCKTVYNGIVFENDDPTNTVFWYILDVFQELSQKTFVYEKNSKDYKNIDRANFYFKYKYGTIYISADTTTSKPISLEIKMTNYDIKLNFLNIKE